MNEKIFISYAWINDEPDNNVLGLVATLRNYGYNVECDVMVSAQETAIHFTEMMASSLQKSDKVIIVLSEEYAKKANMFKGGVGTEYRYIIRDIESNKQKYIFVTFNSDRNKVTPDFLQGREILFLDEGINNLLLKLNEMPAYDLPSVNSNKTLPVAKIVSGINLNLVQDEGKQSNEIYLDYIAKWSKLCDLDNWNGWSSFVLGGGQPRILKKTYDDLLILQEWLYSRIYPTDYQELKNAFENFRRILSDFLKVFSAHMEELGNMWITEKFYHIRVWDEVRYHALLEQFESHVALVQNLMLELTRACNFICDKVREYILNKYRINEGVVYVTYGPCDDLAYRIVKPEYNEDEKKGCPYKGLENFKEDVKKRDIYFNE